MNLRGNEFGTTSFIPPCPLSSPCFFQPSSLLCHCLHLSLPLLRMMHPLLTLRRKQHPPLHLLGNPSLHLQVRPFTLTLIQSTVSSSSPGRSPGTTGSSSDLCITITFGTSEGRFIPHPWLSQTPVLHLQREDIPQDHCTSHEPTLQSLQNFSHQPSQNVGFGIPNLASTLAAALPSTLPLPHQCFCLCQW